MNVNQVLQSIENGQRFRRLHELVKNRYVNRMNLIWRKSIAETDATVQRMAEDLVAAAKAHGLEPECYAVGGLFITLRWPDTSLYKELVLNLETAPPWVRFSRYEAIEGTAVRSSLNRKRIIRRDESPAQIFQRSIPFLFPHHRWNAYNEFNCEACDQTKP